jgi:methionyl-tRNA formyltransferase
MRALLLGSLTPMTARTAWRWLAAGNELGEIWLDANTSGVWRRRDRRLRWLAPQWSLTAAARHRKSVVRFVGPLRRDPQLVQQACRANYDVVISSCFPFIVPTELLGCYGPRAVNLHPALLPRYRGPCPLPAIVFDEAFSASGVTLHVMSPQLDEGDIIAQQPVAWPQDGHFRTWEADLAEASGALVVEALPRFLRGELTATPQTGAASYVRGLPPRALVLDETIDERRARWLASSLGRIMPLTVQHAGQRLAIAGVGIASQPRRSSTPVRVGWRRVEVDLADARLSLRRWDRVIRRTERARELLALARRTLAA